MLKTSNFPGQPRQVVYSPQIDDKYPSLGSGDRGEDSTYPWALLTLPSYNRLLALNNSNASPVWVSVKVFIECLWGSLVSTHSLSLTLDSKLLYNVGRDVRNDESIL